MADTVNSIAREERIARRRARLEARLRAKETNDDETVKTVKPDQEETDQGKGRQQIKKSNIRIDKVKASGHDDVTEVRLVSDNVEYQRRLNEGKAKMDRIQKLAADKGASTAENEKIALNWEPLYEHGLPEELLKNIKQQQELCDAVITKKDELIGDFREDVKEKGDEYSKALKRHAEDIDLLVKRMRQHLSNARKTYNEELREIERAFMQEYSDLIESNRDSIEGLMEKRRTMEVRFMEQRQERIEEQQKQLDQLRTQDAEEYSIIKVKLETWLQDLEQQLEEMRAVYQLNNEKLVYNVQVLKDRGTENANTINVQKKKITRLQDVLSNLKTKYHQTDKEYRQKNIALTEEYRRITEQFKDLQNKFRHFERADARRYREVWQMNEETVVGMARKLLHADKVVTEQQLGLNWMPPDDTVFDSEMSTYGSKPAGKRDVMEDEHDENVSDLARTATPQNVMKVMNILSKEAGFLIDDKVRRLVENLPHEEGDLIKVDAIARSLRIESESGISRLVGAFVDLWRQQAGESENEQYVSSDDAASVIRKFILETQQAEANVPKQVQETDLGGTNTMADRGSPAVVRAVDPDREYWERMGSVVPEKTTRIWTALENAMGQYNQLLLERSKLASKCADVSRQNEELKQLLSSYLTAQVNEDLVIPPIQTLTVPSQQQQTE